MGNKCPSLGPWVPIPWSLSAHRLVPECPLDGQDRHLMVSYRTAYVIFLIQLIPQFGIRDTLSKQLTICWRIRHRLYIRVIGLWTTLSWTSSQHWEHIVSLTTSLWHCKDTASKTRSNFHCSKDRIISFDSLYTAHVWWHGKKSLYCCMRKLQCFEVVNIFDHILFLTVSQFKNITKRKLIWIYIIVKTNRYEFHCWETAKLVFHRFVPIASTNLGLCDTPKYLLSFHEVYAIYMMVAVYLH